MYLILSLPSSSLGIDLMHHVFFRSNYQAIHEQFEISWWVRGLKT
jgi:hypothetical protein